MKRDRNVKIVATLGPASDDYEMIRALHEAGADVFRLNMSHGDHAEIKVRHDIIRQVEQDLDSPIAILADLQGPKLRVGVFANEDGEDLEVGQTFRLDLDDTPGTLERVQLPHKEIFDALEPGSHLLVNDGKIKLRVKDCGRKRIVRIWNLCVNWVWIGWLCLLFSAPLTLKKPACWPKGALRSFPRSRNQLL